MTGTGQYGREEKNEAVEKMGEKYRVSENIREILRVGISRQLFRKTKWYSDVNIHFR